jgi:hypothetical protein
VFFSLRAEWAIGTCWNMQPLFHALTSDNTDPGQRQEINISIFEILKIKKRHIK